MAPGGLFYDSEAILTSSIITLMLQHRNLTIGRMLLETISCDYYFILLRQIVKV